MIVARWTPTPYEPHRARRYSEEWRPGMRVRDALPSASRGLEEGAVYALRNSHPARLDDLLSDGDFVAAMPRPGNAAIGVSLAIQALLFGAGIIIQALSAKNRPVPDRDDESSPTFSSRGIGSNRTEGQPIPKGYGRIRAGGQVINEALANAAAESGATRYLVQLSFGHGPIRAIGDRTTENNVDTPLVSGSEANPIPAGVKINGNEADELVDVVAHVRLGTNEQPPAPGHEFVETLTNIGAVLEQVETSDLPTGPVLDGSETQLVQDPVWDDFGSTFDFTISYDAVRISIRFPIGWQWLFNGGGESLPWYLLLRYIELDSGGVPITTGGNFGDGYVRVPFVHASYKSSSAFLSDWVFPFHDPATYVPPTTGKAFGRGEQFDDTLLALNPPNVPAAWGDPAPGSRFDFFCIASWFRVDDASPVGILWGVQELLTASVGGWQLTVENLEFTVAPGFTEFRRVPVLTLRNGATDKRFHENPDLIGSPSGVYQPGEWAHIVASYEELVFGIAYRIRIWINGQLALETVTTDADARTPDFTSDTFEFGGGQFTGDETELDEAWVLHYAPSHTEVRSWWNNGQGTYGPPAGTDAVVVYHLDENLGSADPAPQVIDSSVYANPGTLFEGADTFKEGFVFKPNAANVRKRGRFRVEVMRNVTLSTAGHVQNLSEWASISGILDQAFSYPGEAVLSIEVRASDQLGTGTPEVTSVGDWRLCPVWDGVSETSPNFIPKWSRYTADVAADLILDRDTGGGKDFGPEDIDLPSLIAFRDFCREIEKDHRVDFRSNQDDVTQGDAAGDANGWLNMVYDETTLDPDSGEQRGTITITFGIQEPPLHWRIGKCVRWSGMQTPASDPGNILLDTNYPAQDGFEIKGLTRGVGGISTVVVWYDRVIDGAPWSGGGSLQGALNPVAPNGAIEGAEFRHLYDAIHDTAVGWWDRLVEVCATARAVPIPVGRRIRFRLNRTRSPVAFVGKPDIIANSWSIVWEPEDKANSFALTFLDEELNWDRSVEPDEHPSVQDTSVLAEVRHSTGFVRGLTRRSAVHRHMRYKLNVNDLLNESGSFRMGPDRVTFEVGSVIILSHDLMDWGIGSRQLVDSSTASEIRSHRPLTVVDTDPTWRVRVRNSLDGAFETGIIDVPVGTTVYAPGDLIPLTAALSFTPKRHDLLLAYKDGDEYLADVVEITLEPGLQCEVRWIKYDVLAYADDFGILDDAPAVEQIPVSLVDKLLPPYVTDVSGEARSSRNEAGAEVHEVTLAWAVDPAELAARGIRSFAIWGRSDADAVLELLGEVDAGRRYAEVTVPHARRLARWVFAVQPISIGGARRLPDYGTLARVQFVAEYSSPPAPTALTHARQEEQRLYLLTAAERADALGHELRRGGWILGQRIGVAFPGQLELGPHRDWAEPISNANGAGEPLVLARSRTPGGRYSAVAVTLVSPTAGPFEPQIHSPREDDAGDFYSEQSWEDFGDGWKWDDATTPTATLTNLQRRTPSELLWGELEFSGASLTADYLPPEPILKGGYEVERYRLEAFVEARQVHPATWDELRHSWDHPLMQRWTWEGPLDRLPGEVVGVTLKIEMRFASNPAAPTQFGDWREYRPGVYQFGAVQFRLVLTRPTSAWDVRIQRFAQRVTRVSRARFERDDVELMTRLPGMP